MAPQERPSETRKGIAMRRRRSYTPALAATALGIALAACGAEDAASPGSTSSATSAAKTTLSTPAVDHNDADVMFAQMMIPHHAQAVEVSDVVLAKGDVDAQVTALAEQIKAAQQAEIDQLTVCLEGWGAQVPDPADPWGGVEGEGHAMEGLLTDAELQALRDAQGPLASVLFLEQMVRHHEGAITMARRQLEAGQSREVAASSQEIIRTQQAEIDLMRQLLDQP